MAMTSRKVRFSYFVAILVTAGFVACGFLQPLQGVFSIYIGAILGLTGLLFAANVTEKATMKDTYMDKFPETPPKE